MYGGMSRSCGHSPLLACVNQAFLKSTCSMPTLQDSSCASGLKALLYMQVDPQTAGVYWLFIEKLIIAHQTTAAVQIAYHGHNVGALRHYKPHKTACSPSRKAALTEVSLESCGTESAIIVLLAWACCFAHALQEGHQIAGHEVFFTIGQPFSSLQVCACSTAQDYSVTKSKDHIPILKRGYTHSI